MNTETQPAPVDESTLNELVGFVWETLFESVALPAPAVAIDGIAASISIGGQWEATMIMELDNELAMRCACQLLHMDASEMDEELLFDSVGEIVNVVGGNVKGLLSADLESKLSLPTVTRSPSAVVGGLLTVNSGFSVDGHAMTWRIFESA